ncbi:MAG: molybdopterin-dependent oxidoreductase [Pseudomonadales bacterium]|nr:molybdopterin-dependent oxidoreductase [Pseudomonadales bacterium]
MENKKTFCSICSAFCGFEATVENNHIIAFTPDKNHIMSKGFSCSKGRHFAELLTSENRVIHCMKNTQHKKQRKTAASWQVLEKEQALDEIAGELKNIINKHGPESVAIYCGNGVTFKALTMPAVHAFMRGLGSHHIYSSLTIDQPAKIISAGRHGVWAGGGHTFESANVLMLIGNNVFVSGLHGPGSIPGWQPGALKEARKRGLKLIVVDPRLTETAQQADLHLAIKPGTDAVFLSGMINYILQNNLEDKNFCEKFTVGLDALSEKVAPYDLSTTAKITGLDEALIREAIALFVKQQRGGVSSGTGPDMSPHGNLTEHLIYSINTLCGRHNRAGDKVPGNLLTPDFPPMEAVVPFDFLPASLNLDMNNKRSRVRNGRQVFNEMPTATLAEEILTPGEGQLKALMVIGGNPALSVPDQAQMLEALENVELCVCIDGRETETASLADYFLPATYGLEKTDMTVFNDFFWGKPFHQIASPVVAAPADATDEHRYLMALANRLGITMTYNDIEIDTANPPADIALLTRMFPAGMTKIDMTDLAAHAGGKLYSQYLALDVIPAMEGMDDKLRFMPEGVAEEFEQLASSLHDAVESRYLLICRRNPHVYNSMCHEFPSAPKNNPAWLHPEDIASEGFSDSDVITVRSAHGEIQATVKADHTLRRGVLALTHGFGGKSGGVSVNRLLNARETTDNYAKIPQMSAVPVQLTKA